jgi:hypothetical protein
MAEAKGDPRKALPLLMERAPRAGMKLQKDIVEWENLGIDGQIKKLDLTGKQYQRMNTLLGGVNDDVSKNAAIDQVIAEKLPIPQRLLEQIRSKPYSEQMKQQLLTQTMSGKEQAEYSLKLLQEKRDAEQATATLNKTEMEMYKTRQELESGVGPSPSADVKNYKFAQSEGYKGTFEQWQKDEANRKPRMESTVVVQTVDTEGRPISKIVPKRAGSEFAAPPTADARKRMEDRGKAEEFINSVQQIGNRVITEKLAIIQKAKSTGRSVDAALANDPDYRTYQDARGALATKIGRMVDPGGRLSDFDVKGVWLPMVPDAFKDTKASAEMKWKLLRRSAGLEVEDAAGEQGGAPQTAAPGSQGGGIKILRDANGRITGIE